MEGAMLEPVNTVLKAVNRMALLRGDYVLVVGQGPIGLIFTRLFTLRGVHVIATDLLEPRRKLSKLSGAQFVLDPAAGGLEERVTRITRKKMLDGAIIAVPSDESVALARKLTRGGAKTLLFAHTHRGEELSLDPSSICVDEKDLMGSYSSDITLQKEVARLIFSRRMDMRRLVSHEFSLAESATAIQIAARPTPDSLKILVSQC